MIENSDNPTLWIEAFKNDQKKLSAIYNASLNIPTELKQRAENILSVNADTIRPPKTGGCYVATCVYGSYDCPEVWTLRRFRDYTLDKTWYGKTFIRLYYAISPKLVKWFGDTEWFKKTWKNKLDKMVRKLKEQGYKDTRYSDKF